MKRLVLMSLLIASSCVVSRGPPPPPPQVVAYYGNEHAIPDEFGGGWCYINGQHEHDYYPAPAGDYVVSGGFYYWNAPIAYTYYSGHPLPGGGWCMIVGPHSHAYYPPPSEGWRYRPGTGYVYEGPYHAESPPPPGYWTHAASAPPPPANATPAPAHPVASAPPSNYHPIRERVREGPATAAEGPRTTAVTAPDRKVEGARQAEVGSKVEAEPARNEAEVAHPAPVEATPAANTPKKATPQAPPPQKKKQKK